MKCSHCEGGLFQGHDLACPSLGKPLHGSLQSQGILPPGAYEQLEAECERLRLSLAAAEKERDLFREALTKISAIRDSIVGHQGFNFSEHAYPLVAALSEAGFTGAGYEISRKNLGTLIEQIQAAESDRDSARAERDALVASLPRCCEFQCRNTATREDYGAEVCDKHTRDKNWRDLPWAPIIRSLAGKGGE